MNARTALSAYKASQTSAVIEDASPHKLIAMLLDGALERIAVADGAIKRGELAATGEAIGKAISIVDSLRVSLDHKQGGDLSEQLSGLYDYMTRRLLEANVTKDAEMLSEVSNLLREIKVAWDEIPSDLHHASE